MFSRSYTDMAGPEPAAPPRAATPSEVRDPQARGAQIDMLILRASLLLGGWFNSE